MNEGVANGCKESAKLPANVPYIDQILLNNKLKWLYLIRFIFVNIELKILKMNVIDYPLN